MKFLLDEMYPAAVAAGLRRVDVDAVAVQEPPDWRGLTDSDLFVAAQLTGRCVVTENIVDFVPIEARWHAEQGTAHAGLVLVASSAFPRAQRATIGRLIRALQQLVDTNRPEPGSVLWLNAPP